MIKGINSAEEQIIQNILKSAGVEKPENWVGSSLDYYFCDR